MVWFCISNPSSEKSNATTVIIYLITDSTIHTGLNALQNISFPTFMTLGLTWVSIEAKFLLEVKF